MISFILHHQKNNKYSVLFFPLMNEVITTFEEDVKGSKNSVVTFEEWASQPLRKLNSFISCY